jgi:hypothetical protein
LPSGETETPSPVAEKAEAPQRWADHITGIVLAEPGKVARLDRARA